MTTNHDHIRDDVRRARIGAGNEMEKLCDHIDQLLEEGQTMRRVLYSAECLIEADLADEQMEPSNRRNRENWREDSMKARLKGVIA